MTTPIFDYDPAVDGPGAYAAPGAPSSPQGTPTGAYFPANQVLLHTAGGAPLTSRLRDDGLRAVVIPRHTPGGIPAGTRPHDTRNVELHIDPHLHGQSATIRVGDITPDRVRAAAQAVAQVLPEELVNRTSDRGHVVGQRIEAAARMHAIAAGLQRQAAAPLQEAPAQPAQRAAPRRVAPLQAFAPAQPGNGQRPSRVIDLPDVPARTAPDGQPPHIEITFEIEPFGQQTAFYHDVYVQPGEQPGCIALFWNTAYRGNKYFPAAPAEGRQQPRLAIHITGSSQVHLVQTTGIIIPFRGYECCLLLVEQTQELSAEE